MFKCIDKGGTQIHIEDLVSEQDESQHIVMNLYEDLTVKLCPVKKGLPKIVPALSVLVKESFIKNLQNLSSCEELQEILNNAETRFNTKPKKGSKGKRKAKAVEEEVELDI